MADTLAARLARLTVLDGDGRAITLGRFWDKRPAVLAITGYAGPLYADPSLATFSAGGLTYGWGRTFHPLNVLRGARAFAAGFRQGARRGNPVQQGDVFVLGPADRVRYEWRDRFAGDHAPIAEVLAALG